MYLFSQITIAAVCIGIAYQDIRTYSFSIYWLVMLSALFLWQGITQLELTAYSFFVAQNVLFLFIAGALVFAFNKIFRPNRSISGMIGNGDVMLLLVLSLGMNLKFFLVLIIISSLLSLIFTFAKEGS
jgi:Flp pilus assembly protein protease CpaA